MVFLNITKFTIGLSDIKSNQFSKSLLIKKKTASKMVTVPYNSNEMI